MKVIAKSYYFLFWMILFLISDLILLIYPISKSFFIPEIMKGGVLIYLFYLFISIKKMNKLFYLVICSYFFLSQFFLFQRGLNNFMDVIENLRIFSWYLFFLFLLESEFFLFQNIKKNELNKINTYLFYVILIVCLFVWIGYVFNISLFRTYNHRFGFKGIIGTSANISYFIVGSLLFLYQRYILTNQKYLFVFTILTSFLVGTKTIYFFLIILFLYHVYQKFTLNKILLIMSFIGIFLLVFKETILRLTMFIWEPFYNLFLINGFWYSLTSFRSQFVIENVVFYKKNWEWYNYLIGGRSSLIMDMEMSFFDLITFFGFIGAFFYITFFLSKIFLNNRNTYNLFFCFSFLIVSFFLGQFYNNGTINLIFINFFSIIKYNHRFMKIKKNLK